MPPDAPPRPRFDRREVAGALGDLGTLLPLASLLITVNGLNPTAVFGIVGAVYLLGGLYYCLPIPVQPLKSFSSLAIGLGLGATTVAAGTAVMGACLLLVALSGAGDWVARAIPRALVRGIQLGVGIILVRAGVRLALAPLPSYPGWLPAALAAGTGLVLLAFAGHHRFPGALLAVAGGAVAGLLLSGVPSLGFGPVVPRPVLPSAGDFWTATVLLVLPQIPLTLTNSVTATRDAARFYFGGGAGRVTGRALTFGLGTATLVAGFAGGMPVCHGSGGLTAHVRFGARTGGAPILLGSCFLALALLFGPSLAGLASVIPRPVLGALLIYVGAAHALLVRDVRGGWAWAIVLATGLAGGISNHNGYGLAAGLAVLAASGVAGVARRRRAPAG